MERDQEDTKTKVARQHWSPPERKERVHFWKKSSERNVSRIDKIGGHWFLDQLTVILENILELLPGVWWAVSIILLSCRSWFSARCWDAIVHSITTRMALQQVYWNQQQVAVSWTGSFIHATGSPPPRKSTVAYFTPIHQPFKDTRCGLVRPVTSFRRRGGSFSTNIIP